MWASELVAQVEAAIKANGDMKVFDMGSELIEHVEVCTTDPDAEVDLYGVRYIEIGRKY